MTKFIYIIPFFLFLFSCDVNKSPSSSQNVSKSQKTTLGLLDRLRSLPGLKISGFDERNAEVYLRGQTSVNFYKEVVFYINGTGKKKREINYNEDPFNTNKQFIVREWNNNGKLVYDRTLFLKRNN